MGESAPCGKRPIERLLRQAQEDLDLLAVILFGSTARGEAMPGSDCDVCLVLSPGRHTPVQLCEKKLDYTAGHTLDVEVFQQLPLYIRRRVLRDGRVRWTRDEERL